jgi:hypothetical protein
MPATKITSLAFALSVLAIPADSFRHPDARPVRVYRVRNIGPATLRDHGARGDEEPCFDQRDGFTHWMDAGGHWCGEERDATGRWMPLRLSEYGSITDYHYEIVEGSFVGVPGHPRRARRAGTTPRTRRALARARRAA